MNALLICLAPIFMHPRDRLENAGLETFSNISGRSETGRRTKPLAR